MHSILKSLLIFLLLAAAGFAQERDFIAEAEKFEQTMTKAKAGDATAQYNLGLMYDNGEGVQLNSFEAGRWFRKAADQGYAVAQLALGLMYSHSGAEQVEWFRLAAEQGNARAQYELGRMYAHGEGVNQDLVQAHVWDFLAGKNGYANISNKNLIESLMTFEQKLEAAKKERALTAEPLKPAVSSGGGGRGGGGGADPSWVIGAVGIAWALVTLARRVSQR